MIKENMSVDRDKNRVELASGIAPLVSITIITYNSANYVLEALESAKAQTYENIELIISDDCSTDGTLNLCRAWLSENADRFVRTKLIVSKENTGINSNMNRSVKEVRGEWIRAIAGDDALIKEAVEYAIDFVKYNSHIKIFTSNKAIYRNTFDDQNLVKITDESKVKNENNVCFYDLNSDGQYKSLLRRNKVNTVGIFVKKELIIHVGGYDERLKNLEDYPMVLKITKQGEKIYCMNKLTIKYRRHNMTVQTLKAKENEIFNKRYLIKREFEKLYIYPNINLFNKVILDYEYYRHYFLDLAKLNRYNLICRGIYFTTSIISLEKLRYFMYKRNIFLNIFR